MGITCSLHCSSFLGLPFKILNTKLVKPKKGTTMETIGMVYFSLMGNAGFRSSEVRLCRVELGCYGALQGLVRAIWAAGLLEVVVRSNPKRWALGFSFTETVCRTILVAGDDLQLLLKDEMTLKSRGPISVHYEVPLP